MAVGRRPLLFVDVDGVLNPYASPNCPAGYVEHDLFPGEEAVRVCAAHGEWLARLSHLFDLVWATSWNDEDKRLLASVLALPEFHGGVSLPSGQFDPREKVPAVKALAGTRPLAWVDDMLTSEAFEWAARREPATLLVPVDPAVGLTEAMVETLVEWARPTG
jgi:hypothetical protein